MGKDALEIKLSRYFVINHTKAFPKHDQACYLPRRLAEKKTQLGWVWKRTGSERRALRGGMEKAPGSREAGWGPAPPTPLRDRGVHILTRQRSDSYNKNLLLYFIIAFLILT